MSSVQIQPPNPAGSPKTAVLGPKIPKGPGAPKKAGQGRPLPSPTNNPQTVGPKIPGSTPPIQIQVPAGNQKTNSRSLPNSPPTIVSGNVAKIESRSAAVSPATSPRNTELSDPSSPRMRPKPLPKAPVRKTNHTETDLEATLSPRNGPSSSPMPITNTNTHANTPPMAVSPPPVRVTPHQDVEVSTSPKPNASAIAMLLAAEQVTGAKMTGYRTRIVDELLKKSRRSIYANDELVKGDAHEDQKKRCLTVTEIIESEKAFLKNMTLAIEHYYNPSKNGESPVPENKAKMMFNNLEQIIEVSTDLLQTMFDKIPNDFDSSVGVGNIFVQFVPRFNVFDEYAKLHYQAIKTFGQLERKKEVVQYWKELRERTGVLDIMALLIMPVQRFLRHKLLLEELLKRTPEGHPDHEDVVKAIGAIDQFAQSVNENVKRHTALQKYNEIERKFGFPKELELPEGSEDIRVFIKEGTLMKVCRKEPKPRYFVLFDDLLVYGESGVLSYSLHRCLDLSKTSVKDVEDTSVMENSFEIYSTGKSFVVFADNIGEKKSWLNSFKQVKLLAANDNQAAIWVNDKMSKCCLKCGREFKAHFRRHHCRACGLLVCSKCSPKTAIVPSVSATSKQRVCNSCFDDIANGITPKKASAHIPDNDLSSEDDDSSSDDDAQKLSRSQTSPSLNSSGGSNKSTSASPDVNRTLKSPETHKRSNTTVPPSNGTNTDNVKKKNTFANLFTTLRGAGKKKEGDQ